jgi:hypothetical protein
VLVCAQPALAQAPDVDPATALRARHAALTEALENSTIQKGLHVESAKSSQAPRGDAYAIVTYPFATVASAFTTPAILCESLILHLNVQYCRATGGEDSPVLSVALGKKTHQPLEDTHQINLKFKAEAAGADFMRIELSAKDGPLDTGNYLIAMELVALDDQRAFMHIQYSYTQGWLARVATSVYFATSGREKVGFTLVADSGDPPQLVRGIRGVLERNTLRYYLAFDAYLHSLASPVEQRFEASIERWFAHTERFARQLREVTRDDYIAMKRAQYVRQQVPGELVVWRAPSRE